MESDDDFEVIGEWTLPQAGKYALSQDGDIVERVGDDIIPLMSDNEFSATVLPHEVNDFFAAMSEVPWSCDRCPVTGVKPTFAQALQASIKHGNSHYKD